MLLINPKQLGMPRLILRRVPAPAVPSCSSAVSGTSSPCHTLYPATSPSSSSSSWFPSDLSSSSACASPSACASSPSSSSCSLSSSSSSYSSSSGSSSPSSPSSSSSPCSSPSTSSSSSSAFSGNSPSFCASTCSSGFSFSSSEAPEGKHWVLVPDERRFLKFKLTLVPTVSSPKRTAEPSKVYTPTQPHTSHTLPQPHTSRTLPQPHTSRTLPQPHTSRTLPQPHTSHTPLHSHIKLIPAQPLTKHAYRQLHKKRPQLKTVEEAKWVRKVRGIIDKRNRQHSVSATKRAAGPPQDGPPQKRSRTN